MAFLKLVEIYLLNIENVDIFYPRMICRMFQTVTTNNFEAYMSYKFGEEF